MDAVGVVVDTGVGLTAEDQKFKRSELHGGGGLNDHSGRIILAFYGAARGSGLGLWISKKIVQMHNVIP